MSSRSTPKHVVIDTLEHARRNVKAHDLEAIKASLRRFGFGAPLVIDARTGRLVGGHGRVDALLQMKADGEKPPQGITRTKAGWRAPAFWWTSADDVEADAFAVALNSVQDAGGYDEASLAQLVAQLGREKLEGTGLTEGEIDALVRAGSVPAPSGKTDSDRVKDPAPLGQNPKGGTTQEETDNLRGSFADTEVRTIALECNEEQYARLVELMAQAREDHRVDTNTEALEAVLATRYPKALDDL